ncbi:MDR family MFS transporter [Streptomyces sp. NBC_00503]|uniref:MDR family MFS transporter n=1 Tax=Streptomyces sp. NBC_00503 TaxID=2903659 RepID=UPI002E81F2C6|nr:MDR family MFS transporter [Streptomyces sp. NBC_00503]WUD83698.1 MFS transporter [Streptomyces sp. NBC_00503]
MTEPETRTTPRRIRLTLLGVMLAMLLGMLDNMVVGTAMPTIAGELGGLAHLSWLVTAYTLATAASTPLWGKLGDLHGRKGTFITAIVIFLVGSGLSGAARSMEQLIAFRALQGIGAGGLAVGAFALIGALVSPRERGRYQGMSATIMAVGTIGGPLLGGFLTSHLGWRWSFYINLPLGAIVLVWIQTMLRLPKRARTDAPPIDAPPIDYAGAALLTATISALVLLTTWGGTQYAWGSPQVIGLAVVGAVALGAFLRSQTRAAEPVLPLSVFRSRNLSLASVMAAVLGAAMFGAVSFLPMYQQSVQGASAANSGMLLLPMVLPIVLASQVVGRVMSRTGRYKVFPVVGGAAVTLGLYLLSTMDASTGRGLSALYMAVLGTGLGLAMQMPMTIAQNSVEMKDMGVASASSPLFRTVGGSLGVALFGSLFARHVDHGMSARAVAAGTHSLFLWGAVLSLAGLAAACFIQEVPLRGKPGPAAPPAAGARQEEGIQA